MAPIEGTGYEIGLLEPLYEPLDPQASRNNDPKPTGELVPPDGGWMPEDPKAAYEAGVSVGRDGVLVKGPAPEHLA